MAYCIENFQNTASGVMVRVYWRCNKHVHDATLITRVAIWLGTTLGGTWGVRQGSYRSNQSSPPVNGLEYTG